MNSVFKIIVALLTIVVFYACEKTIDFKGDNMNPKIVVYGNLMPGYPIRASITESRSLLSDEEFFKSLPNAEVKLFVNDVYTETLEYAGRVDTFRKQLPYDVVKEYIYNNGNYSAQTLAEVGKTYRLEISCDGFDPVSCETTVPQPVEIIKVDTFSEIVETEYSPVKNFWIYIYFHDPAATENYYRLQSQKTSGTVLNLYQLQSGQSYTPSDTILIRTDYNLGIDYFDPVFNNDNQADEIIMGSPNNQYGIFNDSEINGKEYRLAIKNYNSYYGYSPYDPMNGYGEENNNGKEYGNFSLQSLSLISISKDYYNYLNTATYHFWYSDDPFSEPVPVFSNVKGGIGMWSSSSSSEFEILDGIYPMPGKTYLNEYEYYNQGAGYYYGDY